MPVAVSVCFLHTLQEIPLKKFCSSWPLVYRICCRIIGDRRVVFFRKSGSIAIITSASGWNASATFALVLVVCHFSDSFGNNHTYKNLIRPDLTALLTIVFWHPVSSILFNASIASESFLGTKA